MGAQQVDPINNSIPKIYLMKDKKEGKKAGPFPHGLISKKTFFSFQRKKKKKKVTRKYILLINSRGGKSKLKLLLPYGGDCGLVWVFAHPPLRLSAKCKGLLVLPW